MSVKGKERASQEEGEEEVEIEEGEAQPEREDGASQAEDHTGESGVGASAEDEDNNAPVPIAREQTVMFVLHV